MTPSPNTTYMEFHSDTPQGRIYTGGIDEAYAFALKYNGTFINGEDAYEDFLKGIYLVII